MGLFDNRTLNEEEKNQIKIAVNETVEALNAIKDYQSAMRDNNKGICDRLNEGVTDDDKKIKPALIVKMAKARIKEEMLRNEKDAINDVEIALHAVFH